MNHRFSSLISLAVAAAACQPTPSARADGLKDNPRYQVWAKFKPGSSSTLEADLQQAGDSYHITTTRTLISVVDDKLVIETSSSFTVKGKTQTQPPRRETIPAKTHDEDTKELGEINVDALGKTFKCKVLEARGSADRKAPTGNVAGMKGIVFSSEQVPGGIVRLEAEGKDGKPVVFILTGMEVK